MTTTLPPGPAVLPATAVRPADLERRLHAYALDRVAGWGLPLGVAANEGENIGRFLRLTRRQLT